MTLKTPQESHMKTVVIDGVRYVPEVDPLAEVKAAFAAGLAVEWRLAGEVAWMESSKPGWSNVLEWRIAPEKKPDVVLHTPLRRKDATAMTFEVFFTSIREPCDNLRVTFDGETGKLKSAEVL